MAEVGLYEAMRTLRAVRRLRTDPVPEDVIRRVLEAATWAPTGGNRQPWRIIVVRDPERKKRLGVLYMRIWETLSKKYADNLRGLPEDERLKLERMLGAGDYLARHYEEAPVISEVLEGHCSTSF